MKKFVVLLLLAILYCAANGQQKAVASPEIIGPVHLPGTVFCSSAVDLSPYGYVEEEYFLKGNAHRFDLDFNTGLAKISETTFPYKTRIIVRRPQHSQKFNGTVLVEWLNVSNMFDLDSDWWQLHDYLMRSGYIWVGVSAQRAGIHSQKGLKKWSLIRYGSLDVTADSTLLNDELCFDIFTHAVEALKESKTIRPFQKMRPKVIIASGHSQSAFMLTGYYNFFQVSKNVIDGFVIRGAGGKLRTDLNAKVFKVNAETDLVELNQIDIRQPDTDKLITWEFSGTSHADQRFLDCYSKICLRDFGKFDTRECDFPMCSVVPFYYGYAAAIDHMNRWIRTGKVPPAGLQMTYVQTQPTVVLRRDTIGNAMDGIRLPQFDVPVSMNSGVNSGKNSCKYYGTHASFDQKTLKSLYPSHKFYMEKFRASVKANLLSGYILQEDTAAMIREAEKSASLWK